MNQQAEAVAEPPVESVGVARGHQRQPHRLGGHKGAVVAHHRAGGNLSHPHHARLPCEHRLQLGARGGQRLRFRRLGRLKLRVEARRQAVERQPGPQHRLHPVAGGKGGNLRGLPSQ
jgi:hypothetical protein